MARARPGTGSNNWAAADLGPVLDLAAQTGADAQIRDAAGPAVASSPGFAAAPGAQLSAPVVVRGQRTGTAVVRFTDRAWAGRSTTCDALLRAIAGAAGLAALLALLMGLAWPGGSPARWTGSSR